MNALERGAGAVLVGVFLSVGALRGAAPEPVKGPPVQASDLEPNAKVTGFIDGAQTRAFRIRAEAGDFLRFRVVQFEADLAVLLFDPHGNRVRHADDNEEGPERLSWVCAEAGFYRLEIQGFEGGAAHARYDVELLDRRPATAADRDRVRAEDLSDQAWLAQGKGTASDIQSAVDLASRAVPIFHGIGDAKEECLAVRSVALFTAALGDHRKAIEYLDRALPLARKSGDRLDECHVESDLGRFYGRIGETEKALEHDIRAAAIARELGGSHDRAATLNNLGLVYLHIGRYPEALDVLAEALPIARGLQGQNPYANVLTNLGATHLDMEEPAKALEFFLPVPPIWRKLSDREGESNSLFNIGEAYRKLGDMKQAVASYEQALPLARATGSKYGEAYILTQLGAASGERGEGSKALEYLHQALAIRREVADLAGEAATLHEIARAQRRLGLLPEARQSIEEAISRYEIARGNVTSPSMRSSFFASIRPTYEFAIDLLMRMHALDPTKGFDRLALEASERTRARSLVELLSEAHVDLRQGVDAELLARESSLRAGLKDKAEQQMRLSVDPSKAAEAEALARDIGALTMQIDQTDAEIHARSPRFSALAQDQPLKAEALQALLDSDTVLLEFTLAKEGSFVWAVTAQTVTAAALPPRDQIEAIARRLYTALAAPTRYPDGESSEQRRARLRAGRRESTEAAWDLSRAVLAPIAGQLGKKRVVLVAEGALLYVPFSILPVPDGRDGQAELIAEHEIASLPSASALAVIRRFSEGRAAGPGTIAVLADPVFDSRDARVGKTRAARSETPSAAGNRKPEATLEGSLLRSIAETGTDRSGGNRIPRLAYARREADEILSLVRPDRRMAAFDFDASLATATGPAVGGFRFVHFATHGLLNSAHPELSGLVLSLVDHEGRSQPGFLTAAQVYGLKIPADLVVLSGCQTALGKEIRGEGLNGLTQGFLYAGARAVAASLWKVDDEATAELMKVFYRGMLVEALPPAAALRSAQQAVSRNRRWADPFYWAGFILQGDWALPAAPRDGVAK